MALEFAVNSKVMQWPEYGPNGDPCFQVDGSGAAPVAIVTLSDAGTNVATPMLRLRHKSSGVPAAGFGSSIVFQHQDAGGTLFTGAQIQSFLTTATGGAAGTALAFTVNTGGGAPAEAMRIKETKEVNITGDLVHATAGGKVAFFGVASVVQQANASAAGVATVADAPAKAALTAIRTALVNLGLCAATA